MGYGIAFRREVKRNNRQLRWAADARLLGSRVRIPSSTDKCFLGFLCCVGSRLCDELITRSYQLCIVCVWSRDLKQHRDPSSMWELDPPPKSNWAKYCGRASSSSLARQPLVGPGLFKKLCPFVTFVNGTLPILDPSCSLILIKAPFTPATVSPATLLLLWKLTYNNVVLLSPVSLPVFERQERTGDSNSVDRRLYADIRPCKSSHCLQCFLSLADLSPVWKGPNSILQSQFWPSSASSSLKSFNTSLCRPRYQSGFTSSDFVTKLFFLRSGVAA
jgi:hypothetical protein